MKVLVACEESQRVCIEFRKLGHEAYSCDIEPCSGGHPEWHIQDDVLPLLNGNCNFKTVNGDLHHLIGKWDMIIAFPPCTHLAVSGARHFEKKRADGRQLKAIQFFSEFLKADCGKIAIENPVNIIGSDYIKEWFPEYSYMPKCTQYIQPYEYGEKARKKTGLWLKGLPKLIPTKIVEPELVEYTRANGKKTTFSKGFCSGFKQEERSKVRSKTYLGIAKAMAEQWGNNDVLNVKEWRRMTRKERNEIIKFAEKLTDEELEKEYYDAVYSSLGSQCEDMYELGYDIADIVEREKYEKYLGQRADLLGALCEQRGIKLWEKE